MSEFEQRLPQEVADFHVPETGDKGEGKERIEGDIWRPGILDKYKDEVAAAASTKMLRRTEENALRLLGDAKRFEKPMKDRIRAGRILAELRNVISPDIDLHNIVKTGLYNEGEVVKIDDEFVRDLVKGNLENKQIAKTDGMITNLKGYPLYVSAADCAPVGIYDPKNKVMGVFHNGAWGLALKVSENGIAAMGKEYGSKPEDLVVTIAPGVSQAAFDIDENGLNILKARLGDDIEQFAKPSDKEGKHLFDISGAIVHRLTSLGVKPENIEKSVYTTDENNDLFPSARKEGDKDRDNYGFMMVLK